MFYFTVLDRSRPRNTGKTQTFALTFVFCFWLSVEIATAAKVLDVIRRPGHSGGGKGRRRGACAPGGTVRGAAFGGEFGNLAASGELAFAKIQYSSIQCYFQAPAVM